jgi:hypothetical protein
LQISCCGAPAVALQTYALPSAAQTIVPSRWQAPMPAEQG